MDFARAFNSVVHAKLLFNFLILVFPQKLISWIKYFITNRSQAIITGNHISSITIVRKGLPKVSVLGLLLFILYVVTNCFALSLALFRTSTLKFYK